jgi:cytosine/adenosine deaminase-related metal-dependent hydrolase
MSSRPSSQLLLKNGLILIHDSQSHVVPTRADVLIEGGTITKIGPDVEATEGAEIVDCTDKIVSPGFVDTHHHGWQTQLKGRHANEQLLQYMVTGEFEYDALLPRC